MDVPIRGLFNEQQMQLADQKAADNREIAKVISLRHISKTAKNGGSKRPLHWERWKGWPDKFTETLPTKENKRARLDMDMIHMDSEFYQTLLSNESAASHPGNTLSSFFVKLHTRLELEGQIGDWTCANSSIPLQFATSPEQRIAGGSFACMHQIPVLLEDGFNSKSQWACTLLLRSWWKRWDSR